MVKKIYNLSRDWAGYSRGWDYISVEAGSLEEAIELAEDGQYDREVTRDDTDKEEWGEA